MLDRGRVRSKIDELDGYVRDLERFAPPTREAFLQDLGARLACERLMQVCVECLIDLAEMVVSGLKLGLPDDEARAVRRLAEAGVLGEEDARLLNDLRAFRNVLVHLYGKLDLDKEYANLRRMPGDCRRLGRAFRVATDQWAGK